ncbi:hypothetical protein [Litorimonas haliclonae]|uniref:hypothetical protein n=1 Tax=Litorimonas haliclonae TaxID=2081977 RepID=UPI0039F13FBC
MASAPVSKEEVQRRLRACHDLLGTEKSDDVKANTSLDTARRVLVTLDLSLELSEDEIAALKSTP